MYEDGEARTNLLETLLDADQIELDDNFFRLGADSITAMRLVSLARKEGIAMTVDQIFKNSTLFDIALIARDESLIKIVDLPPFSLLEPTDVASLCLEAVSQCHILINQIEDIYQTTPLQDMWIRGTAKQGKVLRAN